MMKLRFSWPTLLLMVVIAGPLLAQDPAPRGAGPGGGRGQGRIGGPQRPLPPRDPAARQPLPAGTGVIAGTVTVPGTGQPARRARVTLNAMEAGGSRTATTDDNGQYAFAGVAAGRYNLSASKAGHVGVNYGQTRPGRPGTPIQLREGETFAANLQLPRGSVITGIVLDEHGEPTPGTQVRVLRYVIQGGRRTLQQSGSGSTDDRGIYRVYGLQPGEYVVSAVPRNAGGPPIDVQRLQSELEGVRARISAAGPDSAGARELAVRASMLQAEVPQQEEQATGYAPIYFPGTVAASDAAPVTLNIGEERANVDFQLQRVPMARVEGIIVNSTGQAPQNVQVTLTTPTQSVPGAGAITARADAEGRFRLTNVPPGNYRLIARANVTPARTAADATTPPGRGGRGNAQPAIRLWGSVDVAVDGRNLANVVVPLQMGLTLTGRLAFDGITQPPPTDLTRIRVNLAPIELPAAGGLMQPAAGSVDANGKFTIPSVVPGMYRLTASGAGSGWSLESSTIDGQDTLDFPVDVKPGVTLGSAVITFTDRQAQLSGAITNQRGEPAPSFTLILYAADERFWAPQSRRIRSTRPATDGQFTFSGFPPGDYKLVALADVEPGAWYDPAFLQQMEGASISIRIGEGEKKVQNVQISSQ